MGEFCFGKALVQVTTIGGRGPKASGGAPNLHKISTLSTNLEFQRELRRIAPQRFLTSAVIVCPESICGDRIDCTHIYRIKSFREPEDLCILMTCAFEE